MRTRLRLGAATVVALGALLLATALASPAIAWDSSVEVDAYCLESGEVQVDYTVTAFAPGYPADVTVTYSLNGGPEEDAPGGEFTEDSDSFDGSVVLPKGSKGVVTVYATAAWEGDSPTTDEGHAKLPKPWKCKDKDTTTSHDDSTTSSSVDDTTSSSEQEETTTSSDQEETTTSEVLGETSTTGGGQLPFTGASSGPMLLAGLGLVGGGLLFLWSSRSRDRRASS